MSESDYKLLLCLNKLWFDLQVKMYQCVQCVQCALVFSPVYTSVQISLISFSDGIFFCIKGGPAYSGSSKDGEDRASFIQSG